MNRSVQARVAEALAEVLGSRYGRAAFRPSGAGCINETWEAYGPALEPVFLKIGAGDAATLYRQEEKGLQALRHCDAIRVPGVLGLLEWEDGAALALEFIELHSPRPADDHRIGEALAQLHAVPGPRFGFDADNFIGRTPQINHWHDDWWTFWCECRLTPQLRLARLKGMRVELQDKVERLIARVPEAFGAHQPRPSLLHGDLWSGNLAVDAEGMPVLFDPAVYFGDGETDIAMTRMFGAQRAAVYDAYHAHIPLQPGAAIRRPLYDLYHWLNHFNLFGVTYLGQVENTVDDLLAANF